MNHISEPLSRNMLTLGSCVLYDQLFTKVDSKSQSLSQMIINSDRPRFASAPLAAAWHLYSSPIDDQHPKISKHRGNVGRLVALLRDGPTISMDIAEWTND